MYVTWTITMELYPKPKENIQDQNSTWTITMNFTLSLRESIEQHMACNNELYTKPKRIYRTAHGL